MAVNNEAAVAALSVSAFAVGSNTFCVAEAAWNSKPFVSAKKMLRSCRSAVADGVAVLPARVYVFTSRSEMPSVGQRATTPFT